LKYYNRYIRLIILILFVWIFFTLIQKFPIYNRVELEKFLENIRGNANFEIIFIVISIVMSVFFVPISWFIAAGAILFGVLKGFIYSLTAATTSAIISFIIAKCLKNSMPGFLMKKIYPSRLKISPETLARNIDQDGLKIMFILRNIPLIPFVAVNYISGMASIKFKTFVMGSFFGMVPGIFVSTFFFSKISDAQSDPFSAIMGLIVIIAYITLVLVLEKKLRKRKKTIEIAQANPLKENDKDK
jgi:uncharacterized membrane protein YdjX (TVP38/TMEM64 family)